MNSITAVIVGALLMFPLPASAQWATHPDNSIPRARDGKPNLSARAPRAPDGKPDLSGVWLPDPDPNGIPIGVESITGIVVPRYMVDITADLKPEDVPFQPWSEALFKQRFQSQGKDDPIARCQPTGVPALGAIPLPYKIIQTPRLIAILYEENSVFLQIFS